MDLPQPEPNPRQDDAHLSPRTCGRRQLKGVVIPYKRSAPVDGGDVESAPDSAVVEDAARNDSPAKKARGGSSRAVSTGQHAHRHGDISLSEVAEQVVDKASVAITNGQQTEQTAETRADTPAERDPVGGSSTASAPAQPDNGPTQTLSMSHFLPSEDGAVQPPESATVATRADNAPSQDLNVPASLPSPDAVPPSEPTTTATQTAVATTPVKSATQAKSRRWYPNVDASFSETHAHLPLMAMPRRPTPEPFTDTEDSEADTNPASPLLSPVTEEIQKHAPFDAMFGEAESTLRLINARFAKLRRKKSTLR